MPLKSEGLDLACGMAPDIVKRASEAKISPHLFAALIFVESRWKPKSVSPAGACGLTQVIPKYSKFTCKQLKDPSVSLRAGSEAFVAWRDYARKTRRREGGTSTRRILSCYNAGIKCLDSKKGRRYASMVLRYSRILKNNSIGR